MNKKERKKRRKEIKKAIKEAEDSGAYEATEHITSEVLKRYIKNKPPKH